MNLRGYVRLFTHIQLLPVLESGEETTLMGGQAVMEGVMMRSPHSYCVAVRKSTAKSRPKSARCLVYRTDIRYSSCPWSADWAHSATRCGWG